MFSKETFANLLNNNRFYVLVSSVLISVFVVSLVRFQVADDKLYYVQVAQIFGFIAVAFLYATLFISPAKKVIGPSRLMENIVFSRRALGVSAAYFALLHSSILLWGTMGGLGGLALLPGRFIWPLLCGGVALMILGGLAFISVDKMVILLGYRRWKWLQRLVYASGVLIVVHTWSIGVHFGSGTVRSIVTGALIVLFALEAWRTADFLAARYHWQSRVKYVLFLVFWGAGVLLLSFVVLSRPANSHMVLKDTVAGGGAVLHVSPDDDPIAGERATLAFDIQAAPNPDLSTAELTITDDQQVVTSVPGRIRGHMVMADYTFPRQGLYNVGFTIRQEGAIINQFSQSLRVSRGLIYGTTTPKAPLWATVGLWGSVAAALGVAIVAISRRKAIGSYSKL